MGTSRLAFWIGLAFAWTMCGKIVAAADTRLGANNVPSALVTTNTKQVYRFHFSGLQGADAVRLAEQLWPVVSKLPAENPLHRTFLDAKDRAGFIDDYRSLRSIFLEAGIDTIYFLADEHWIEARTLPGTVAIPGDAAVRDRLQRRLQESGYDAWAASMAEFQPSARAPGWLVFSIGAVAGGQTSPAKKALVDHAFKESCPIKPAAAHLGSLPALRIALNEATPLTVVNLERNTLDAVLTDILKALAPASEQTAALSQRVKQVEATTVAASVYPFPLVRQVAHMKNVAAAKGFAAEVKKQIDGAAEQIANLDEDFGPLLELFARSIVLVSTEGSDVHMVLKPPLLFDLNLAQLKALEAQDLDWTALPPPSGYHWDVIGSVGEASRSDVFARVRAVRVRGAAAAIAPDDPAPALARFRIPLADSGLVLYRNLKGQLKVDLAAKGTKPKDLPALDLLDDRGGVAAVLRLDLGPGDPRYDLARTRAVLAKRIPERTKAELTAKKAADDVENAHQRAMLDQTALASPEKFAEWEIKLLDKRRAHGMQQAAIQVLQELDDQARESQRMYPGSTLVKDSNASAGGEAAWAVDRNKFPFAGQWAFDYGVLTLHQDASGAVAGVFATKVFYYTGKYEIDPTKAITGSAILVGRAQGSTLKFTMFDFRGKERTGRLVLDTDGTGGTWSLGPTDAEPPKRAAKTPARGLGLALPQPATRQTKGAEAARSGPLDRIEVAAPEPLCVQKVPTASFAGYWVHPTDKRMNILFKAQDSGLLEGTHGNIPSATGNLRAAAAGNLLLVLENVNTGLVSPSVRAAVLSADGDKLTFLAPREKNSTSGLIGPNSKPLELTRDSSQ